MTGSARSAALTEVPRAALLGWVAAAALALSACHQTQQGGAPAKLTAEHCDAQAVRDSDRARVIARAEMYLEAEPRTVTADRAVRSAGGPNDFYSEGDYWWPVPGEPDAPYQRRDGQSNPDNFVAHRLSMIRLSDIVGALASAHRLTGDQKYADAANIHLRAWFVSPDTRMTPALLYSQAIQGRHTGRSIGLIDTLHLVEVARGAMLLGEAGALPADDYTAVRDWFGTYARWMNTHPYGERERDWHNNHALAWGLQVAAFADLAGDAALEDQVREAFKSQYIDQMDVDGGFPDELGRTKPYGYSLFVLDLLAGIAAVLSTPDDDLWRYARPDGRSLRAGLDFMAPHVADKDSWPYGRDVAYWEEWPVRHPAFLLAGPALGDCAVALLVADAPTDPDAYEVRRNFPLRHPVLWVE